MGRRGPGPSSVSQGPRHQYSKESSTPPLLNPCQPAGWGARGRRGEARGGRALLTSLPAHTPLSNFPFPPPPCTLHPASSQASAFPAHLPPSSPRPHSMLCIPHHPGWTTRGRKRRSRSLGKQHRAVNFFFFAPALETIKLHHLVTLGWHVPALYNVTLSLPGHLCAVSSPGSHATIHPSHQILPKAIKIWALSSNCLQKSKGNETRL